MLLLLLLAAAPPPLLLRMMMQWCHLAVPRSRRGFSGLPMRNKKMTASLRAGRVVVFKHASQSSFEGKCDGLQHAWH
jgi:hypothetical protein